MPLFFFWHWNSAPNNWAQLHLLLQQSTHTMGTFFTWKGRWRWGEVLGGGALGIWMVGVEGGNKMGMVTVLLWLCRQCWVRHFECRLCYTYTAPQSSEAAGHSFCGYYECWGLYECQGLFLRSSRTRMFLLGPPHRGQSVGFYFAYIETGNSLQYLHCVYEMLQC